MSAVAVKKSDGQVGYKQTELGLIPEDWEIKCLGDIGDIRMCKRVFNHETSPVGEIPFYKIGTFGGVPDAYISKKLFDTYRSKFSYPKVGDILISAAGTIGRTVVFDGHNSYYQDSNIVWIENNENLVINNFLHYVLYIVRYGTEGGTIQRLYNNIIKKTKFIVPQNSAEQEAIAKALSDADALIESLEQLIAKKRQIKQGAMQDLLTGKKRLPGYKKPWKEQCLGDVAILKARIGWQGLTTKEYLNTGNFYLVTGTEFSSGKIDWEKCFYVDEVRYSQDKYIQVKEQDILVTKDGTIGKVAFIKDVPKPATLNSGVFVIRPKNGDFEPEFFYYLLMSSVFDKFLTQLSAGSTINHLYQKDFVTFKYSLPQEVSEQKMIAGTLRGMDDEISSLEIKLGKARQIKQGMMQDLLTGRVRLI